jgi:soluble lytic murein transglycosylase
VLLESTAPGSPAAVEPLTLVRRAAATLASSKADRARAEDLERRALAMLSPEQLALNALPSVEQRLAKVVGLLESREHVLTDRAATDLIATLPKEERYGSAGCEALVLRAKALAGLREYGSGVEALAEGRQHCAGDTDRGARIFYLSGRYAASEGRWVHATSFFAELEKRYPTHSLTDDARYYAAIAQQELGVESRFTELWLSLPDDYPTGDMTAEGLFRLALRRIERGAWNEAIGLLERGIRHVGALDRERGLDLAGRERYFRARALLALGDRASARAELEDIVQSYPFSYYMVQAYSLLERLEPGSGEARLESAAVNAASQPFRIAGRSELERPGFVRMMELLRIGELDPAVRELDALGLRGEGTGSEILWGIAMLYERAGFSKFSADLARRQLRDVVTRWPVGGWERAWQIAFPRPHLDIVNRETKTSGVDFALVYAVMREESAFDPEVVSSANAYGLMQLIEPTARMLAKSSNLPTHPEALKRPRVNVALGCRMLSNLAANFEQNPLLAIPAYNAGPGRARRWVRERPRTEFDLWVELIPYTETRKYTKRVLSSRAVYAFLYERERARGRLLLPLLAATPPDPQP